MPRILFDGAGLDFSSSEGASPNVLLEWLSIIPVFQFFEWSNRWSFFIELADQYC